MNMGKDLKKFKSLNKLVLNDAEALVKDTNRKPPKDTLTYHVLNSANQTVKRKSSKKAVA